MHGDEEDRPDSGTVHDRQRGSVKVPLCGASICPQPPQRSRRAAQARQRAWPVNVDHWHGATRPHSPQRPTAGVLHEAQSGPSAVRLFTGRRWPHRTQGSAFAGSRARHPAQMG